MGGAGGRPALRPHPGRPDLPLPLRAPPPRAGPLEDGLLTLSLSEQYGGLADVSPHSGGLLPGPSP